MLRPYPNLLQTGSMIVDQCSMCHTIQATYYVPFVVPLSINSISPHTCLSCLSGGGLVNQEPQHSVGNTLYGGERSEELNW